MLVFLTFFQPWLIRISIQDGLWYPRHLKLLYNGYVVHHPSIIFSDNLCFILLKRIFYCFLFCKIILTTYFSGISRDSRHKRSHTGAKRAHYRKKRKFELGRQPSNTRIGPKRIHTVRVRGGNEKFRALRLEAGNFSWASEAITRKTRIIDVVYNASNNELVRTKTLVKNSIVQIDATPFRQWWEQHYCQLLGKRKSQKNIDAGAEQSEEVKKSKSLLAKIASRKADAHVEPAIEEEFITGRLYASISSRPGQSGRCDGYILEGKELEFYLKKIKSKK